jgi:hypothetical protein
MAFDPQLDPGEAVEHDIDLLISKKPQVRLVLTSKAAYWPGKKTFAVSDPITTVRVASDQITEIYVGRKSRVGSIIGGVALVLIGLAWTLANYPEAFWVGYPQALIVGGIGVAAFGGRRFVLRIQSGDQRLKWVAPIAFGSSVKRDIRDMFTKVGDWSGRHAISVRVGNDKRNAS